MYPNDYLNREDSATVHFYSSPYDPLNNWSAHQIKLWGKTFASAEHAYQFKKFDMTDGDVAQKMLLAPSAWAAHELAQTYKALKRDDWDGLKLNIMHEILAAKTQQNEDVEERLKSTGARTIIAEGESYWGCGSDGLGENNLGKIWMSIRGGEAEDGRAVIGEVS